jgi:hypothetical protein
MIFLFPTLFLIFSPFKSNFSATHPHTPQLLFILGQERSWWVTCNYPTVLKEKHKQEQKEYNLRYLLAKVRTT